MAINGYTIQFRSISTGVLQGSVLGPLLFLVFIHDLPECLKCTASNIYADDTEIHSCGNTIPEVSSRLQQDVSNVVKWLKDNKLVLNGDKSFCMLTSSNRNIVNEELDVCIDGVRIEQVHGLKYLGTHPDSMMSWSSHIAKLGNKRAPKVGLLRRLKRIVPTDCLKLIYQTTVQFHIDYCLSVYQTIVYQTIVYQSGVLPPMFIFMKYSICRIVQLE